MSGLDSQVVPLAFNQGLDTRTNSKLVIPSKWLDLKNVTLSQDNTPQVRAGHSTAISTTSGNGLFTRGNELLAISGPNVKSVSISNLSAATVTGVPGYVGISKTEIQRNTGMQDCADVAYGLGFTCYVWRAKDGLAAATGLAMTLVDEYTGTQLQSNVTLRTSGTMAGAWIRVVATSDAFMIFYRDGNNIYCRVVEFIAPTTLGAETAIISSASVAGVCAGEACVFGNSGASAMLVYGWSDGTTSVRTVRVDHSGTTPSIGLGPTNVITEAQLGIAGLTAVTCCAFGDGSHAAVGATGNTGAKSGIVGAVIDTTWAVSAGNTRLDTTVSATTSANHLVCIAEPASTTRVRFFRDFISEVTTSSLTNIQELQMSTGAILTAGPLSVQPSATYSGATAFGPNGPFIYGKPFTNGTNVFLPLFVFEVYNSTSSASSNPRTANTQSTFFLLDCSTSASGSFPAQSGIKVAGRALYGSLGMAVVNGTTPAISVCSAATVVTNQTFAILAGELTQLVLSNGVNISPTGLVRLTLTPNKSLPLSHAELGESAYLAGGQLSAYDGQTVSEQCFPLFPEGIKLTAGGGGTGNMSDGTYQVVAIYAWVDNAGQRHQSAPCLPTTVSLAAGVNTQSIVVSIPTLLVSQKSGVEIQVFCTTASGLIFYRSLSTVSLPNSTAANAVTFTIQDTDAARSSQEPLYTQPNQSPTTLPSLAPSPCTYVWTAHRRLWFDKSDKPGWFGYSQEYVNNVGLQFNDALEDSLPVESGGFVAGAQLDEKVVLFGRRRIYVMYGTGPNASGSFNNYSHPQDIQADVGCSDALSVLAEIPQGVIFKAQKGWHLLGRDLSVTYIGEAVAQFDANTVTSAAILEDRKECRFTTSGTGGGLNGATLVFSYLIGQWSYFSYCAGGYIPVGAAWWPVVNRYYTTSPTTGINGDSDATFDDIIGAGTYGIQTKMRTSWLHVSKLEGFQRVRWLYLTASWPGNYFAPMSLAVDYDDTTGNVATGSYTDAFDLPSTNSPPLAAVDLRHKLRRMKCKSVAFTIIANTSADENFVAPSFQALALEVGIKKGINKLPAAQTI